MHIFCHTMLLYYCTHIRAVLIGELGPVFKGLHLFYFNFSSTGPIY